MGFLAGAAGGGATAGAGTAAAEGAATSAATSAAMEGAAASAAESAAASAATEAAASAAAESAAAGAVEGAASGAAEGAATGAMEGAAPIAESPLSSMTDPSTSSPIVDPAGFESPTAANPMTADASKAGQPSSTNSFKDFMNSDYGKLLQSQMGGGGKVPNTNVGHFTPAPTMNPGAGNGGHFQQLMQYLSSIGKR